MFEKATRLKLRYESTRGALSTEDLWDLPLTSTNGPSLDNLAQGLSKQLKETTTESFVVKTTVADSTLQLKFDVVKHIIDVRLAERDKAALAKETKEKKERILSIISRKQDETLENTSLEDLQKMVASL